MRLKQKMALLLAGVMLAGSVSILNPTEVEAEAATNTFTLTVPGDYTIKNYGWNSIGNVGVTNVSIASGCKIRVEIDGGATGRHLVNTEDNRKNVAYEIKKGSSASNEEYGTVEFTANGTQAIGAVVEEFSNADNGTYEDTIDFKATFVGAGEYILTGSNAPAGTKLTSADLLASKTSDTGTYSTFEYNGINYTAYNGYIDDTAYANWDDAQAFIEELNKVELDGRTGGWTLLSNADMAYAWWVSTDSEENKGAGSFGDVYSLWSSADTGSNGTYWNCLFAETFAEKGYGAAFVKYLAWGPSGKSVSNPYYGFVVLRGSEDK